MADNNCDGRNTGNVGGDKKEVQYFDSDFSFEEHAADCLAQKELASSSDTDADGSSSALTEDDDDLLPQSQSKCWDAFHSNHSAGNFYKPRRYLTKSFPCIMQYVEHGIIGDNADEDRILLEIGCGSGSSCIPIIKQCSEMEQREGGGDVRHVLLACDSSSVAVETTRRSIENITKNEKSGVTMPDNFTFGAFVADPSLSEDESKVPFLKDVLASYDPMSSSSRSDDNVTDGMVGIVLMVFVLSAVMPSRANRFLDQIYQTTSPGGKICFRDYGVYDVPMLRFNPSAACSSSTSTDPVFVRGEGTIARFFSVETTKELFESAGFTTVELRYCTVFNHNRKTGQKLKRVFVHGVFEKTRKHQ